MKRSKRRRDREVVSNPQKEDRWTQMPSTHRGAEQPKSFRNQGAGTSLGTQVEVASPPSKPESLSNFRDQGQSREKLSWSRPLEIYEGGLRVNTVWTQVASLAL